jgi:hypothetical protein
MDYRYWTRDYVNGEGFRVTRWRKRATLWARPEMVYERLTYDEAFDVMEMDTFYVVAALAAGLEVDQD